MIEIGINEPASCRCLDSAKLVISCFGGVECIESVKLDVRKALPRYEDFKRIPVTICMRIPDVCDKDWAEIEIYIKNFTCGHSGTGSHYLVELLKFTGVSFKEEDVYLKDEMIGTFYRA